MDLKEHKNIIQFMSLISNESSNIRAAIQNALHQVWGYDVMAFWYTDSKGNINYPELFGVPNKVIYDYIDQYEQYDFLHPKLYINRLHEQSVFNVNNTITYDGLESEKYFMDFMKKHNFIDEMVVNFTYQGNLVGTLGLLSNKGRRNYNQLDVKRFQIIGNAIANRIVQSEEIERLEKELEVLRRNMDLSDIAYIIVNEEQRILYKNETALKYSSDLMDGKASLKFERLIEKMLVMYEQKGITFQMSTEQYQYDFQCTGNFTWQMENTFDSILLIKIKRKKKQTLQALKETYHLTNRELEICHCIMNGMTNEEIAEDLFITVNTVKRHIQNVFGKLGVNKRVDIARVFLGEG